VGKVARARFDEAWMEALSRIQSVLQSHMAETGRLRAKRRPCVVGDEGDGFIDQVAEPSRHLDQLVIRSREAPTCRRFHEHFQQVLALVACS
jgi:hypothetical protein